MCLTYMLLGHRLPGIRVSGSREVNDKSRGPRVGVGDGDATPNEGLGVAEEMDERGKNEKVELADDVVVGGESSVIGLLCEEPDMDKDEMMSGERRGRFEGLKVSEHGSCLILTTFQ
jgi:hypothetical protein